MDELIEAALGCFADSCKYIANGLTLLLVLSTLTDRFGPVDVSVVHRADSIGYMVALYAFSIVLAGLKDME